MTAEQSIVANMYDGGRTPFDIGKIVLVADFASGLARRKG